MCWNLQGILERLNAGEVVVGDGGYVLQLERRGYVKAGHWTPEAAVEHPEAGIKIFGIFSIKGVFFFFYSHENDHTNLSTMVGFALVWKCS